MIPKIKKLLKENGMRSYIVSNQFLVAEYGRKTREFLLKKFKILEIIDFGDQQVFQDASTYVAIFILQNSSPKNFNYLRIYEKILKNLLIAKNQ